MQPKGINYILLKDGRSLCPDCSSFKIMNTNECQPLFHEVQEFFSSLNMKLNQEIPLGIVEREALNNAMEGEKNVSDIEASLLVLHGILPFLSHQFVIHLFGSGTSPFIRNSRALLVGRANHSHC